MSPHSHRPTRVLHVAQPTTAGVARVVDQYVMALTSSTSDGRRFAVAVACPSDGRLHTDVVDGGAEHLPWTAVREPGLSVARETRDLQRIIDRWRPDIIHLHSAKAGLVGRLAVRGRIPTVFQPHAWSFHAARGPAGSVAARWERFASRWTTATVNVGDHERQIGESNGIAGPFHRILNRADVADWGPDDRAVARRTLGIPADSPVAVCVARLCEQKGQDRLLAIWDRVRAEVPGARLYLVGPEQEGVPIGHVRPDGVFLVGPAAPRPWYAAADAVLLPSRWEGLPMVALEAEAAGRVVIATGEAGAAGFLEPDDQVPGADLDALARRVIYRLADRAGTDDAGRIARRRAEARPGIHSISTELRDLYIQVMSADRALEGVPS